MSAIPTQRLKIVILIYIQTNNTSRIPDTVVADDAPTVRGATKGNREVDRVFPCRPFN